MNGMKKTRIASGLTQTDVAKELGLNQSTVSMWETGTSMPNPRLLPEIAKLYHCTVDELLAESPPEEQEKVAPA